MPSPFRAGEMLANYRILEPLGSGGMGDVYRALDTRLGRTVALKLLRAEAISDPERRKRFVQEARTASSLDHPNIVTVHDFVEAEGRHFIVMQHVAGKTLRELIGRLDLRKALAYAEQMADGLAAAHAHGIIHRDLKPDNVIVSDQGIVKILDFGLAKLVEPFERTEGPTREKGLALTEEGVILGTPAYMSPEQVEGRELDARSDIFSFGSILYEMVTGRRAFAGETAPLLMASIARDEPRPVTDFAPSVPVDLEKAISRALRKEPNRRWQSMADVRVALSEIREEIESGRVSAVRPSAPRSSHRFGWLAAALVLASAAAVGGLYWLTRREPPLPVTTVPLTTLPGSETDPALSPDGSIVAFVWDGGTGGPPQLYVKLTSGGDPLALAQGGGDAYSPAWSPDGKEIAFLRHRTENGETGSDVLVVSALGGQPRRVGTTEGNERGLSWSPDGNQIAIVDRASPGDKMDSIFLLSLETGSKRRVSVPPERTSYGGDVSPSFSPDGEKIAFVRKTSGWAASLYVQSVRGGEPIEMAAHEQIIHSVDWVADGSALVYSAGDQILGGGIYIVSLDDRTVRPLPFAERVRGVSLSRKGNTLAYSKSLTIWNIWRVSGPNAREKEGPRRFSESTRLDFAPYFSPDGRYVLSQSNRAGAWQVWRCESDGAHCLQLKTDFDSVSIRWSPNGRRIAFTGIVGGNPDIYVIDSEGGPWKRLTTEPSGEFVRGWSRDGAWIYFDRWSFGACQGFRVPVEGGPATPITAEGWTFGEESRDRRYLILQEAHPSARAGIWRVPVEGGQKTLVLETPVHSWSWTLWKDNIVYLNAAAEEPRIEMLNLATGRVTEIAKPAPGARFSMGVTVSPDGQVILYGQQDQSGSDLVLVENFN